MRLTGTVRPIGRGRLVLAALLGLPFCGGCEATDPLTLWVNTILNTTSLRRGNVTIGFINNTQARAIFTFGTYDQLDEDTLPDFSQLRLEPNSASNSVTRTCARTFSIGGADLLRLIRQSGQVINDDRAMVVGVNFSGAPANDPLGAEPTEGTAPPLELLNGVDFTCAGLLLFIFEQDAAVAGGFRIDYRFIPE